jgi:hypothetical protein
MGTNLGVVAMLKSFVSHTSALDYLKHEGFTFMGVPGRWMHLDDHSAVYARILPTGGIFQVRVMRLEKK